MDMPDVADKLFSMLQEYGAERLDLVPEDDNGKPLGAIIVVAAPAVERTLEALDGLEMDSIAQGWEPADEDDSE